MANYIQLTWSNTCDIGNVLYNGSGFSNKFFFDGDIIKPDYSYEVEEKENGDGVLLQSTQALKKRYKFETLAPEYVADALSFMALHDTIQLVFMNGHYSTTIRNVRVDVIWEDDFNGCMALITVSFEQDDQIIKTACCDNMV